MQSFVGAVLNGGAAYLLLMLSPIHGLRQSARDKSNRFPKRSKARLLVLSEKLQFLGIGHTRGTTMFPVELQPSSAALSSAQPSLPVTLLLPHLFRSRWQIPRQAAAHRRCH